MRKITDDLEVEIQRRAAAGESVRSIAAWCGTQGVKVSHQAIDKLVRLNRQRLAEMTKSAVRERLGKTVLSDLDRLERIRKVLHRKAQRWHDAADPEMPDGVAATKVWTGIVAQEHRCIVDKLHYAGADAPERMSDAEVERRWQELRRAIAEADG